MPKPIQVKPHDTGPAFNMQHHSINRPMGASNISPLEKAPPSKKHKESHKFV